MAKQGINVARELPSLDEINDEDFESLIKRGDWGALNFETIRAELVLLREISRQIAATPLDILPTTDREALASFQVALRSVVNRINRFSITDADPKPRQETIINQVRGALSSARTNVVPLLSLVSLLDQAKEMREQLSKSQHDYLLSLMELQKEIADSKAQLPIIVQEAEESAAKARDAATAAAEASQNNAARTGVSVHEGDFKNEVAALESARTKWLWASLALGFAAIGAAIGFSIYFTSVENYLLAIQQGVTKLFVVGTLVSGAVWCASIYRALSHQVTVNRHRMNALRTFKTFVSAAETAEVRQAILLETTRTIFGSAPTGYLPASESNSDTSSKAADMLSKGLKLGGS